jgi:hypothetical protein
MNIQAEVTPRSSNAILNSSMIDIPYDILFLIADYFEPSELRTLASFHQYFLREYLKQKYSKARMTLVDSCAVEQREEILASIRHFR